MFSLLAQSTAGTGEGLEYSLEPTWSFAPALVLLCVVLGIAAVVVVYLRERGSAGPGLRVSLAMIRVVLMLMTFVMLLGWVLHRDRTDLPDIVVLIDDSQSMRFEDHIADRRVARRLARRATSVGLGDSSRVTHAKTLLLENNAAFVDRLAQRYNLKVYRMGSTLRAEAGRESRALLDSIRSLAADEPVSSLGKCVRNVVELQRGRPTAAIIALTDGITTEGKSIGDVAQYARRKSVPLFIVGLGSDLPPRDVRLSDLLVDDVVFVNDIVNFEARLTATGYQGDNITVRLRQLNSETVLAEQVVAIQEDRHSQSVRLAFRPETAGEFTYVVDSEPLVGESDPDNNRMETTIQVRDESIRVLLVQQYPSFEYRYLSTVLGRQVTDEASTSAKSIELTTVLQEADEEYVAADDRFRRVFPVSRDELFQYDVILLGDVNPVGLGQLEMNNIADFVKTRGGGVVFIAGPRYMPIAYQSTPLAELIPIDIASASVPATQAPLTELFQVQPTRLGITAGHMQLSENPRENLRIWHGLSGLYWLLEAPELKPAARVLAEHPSRTGRDGRNLPVILTQFSGAGKTIFHATDETYRWQHRVGDQFFARYWIQTIRYLSRSKLLGQNRGAEIVADSDQYERGEPVYLRVRFFDERLAPPNDDGVSVVIQREENRRRHVRLVRESTSRGVFVGSLSDLDAGQYRVWLASPVLEGAPPSTRLSVVDPPGEQAQLQMDADDLQHAAEVSDGRFYTMSNADQLVEDLPRGRQVRIASLPPVSIWGTLPVAIGFGLLFVGLIAIEWILRKRHGML